METNKEVKKPTTGKWQISETDYAIQIAQWGDGWISVLCEISKLPHYDKDKVLATAFKICEAVNEYDKLKADNGKLISALKTIQSGLFEWNGEGKYQNLIEYAKTAIKQSEAK